MGVTQQHREVAGYRVLRPLARGLLLGFDPRDEHLVLLEPAPAGDPAAGRTLAALERARGEHVITLLDYAADDDREILVLERLPRGDLAALLARSSGLDGGEAVTIIAPIAATVARLHRAGVAHGDLDAGSVRFRDDGAPVLTGFAAAGLFAPGAPEVVLESIAEVAADRRALGLLAAAVLGAVTGSRARAARALAGELGDVDPAALAEFLATRVFEIAAATPVRWEVADEPAGPKPGVARLVPLAEPVAAEVAPEPRWRSVVADLVERSPLELVLPALRERWAGWSRGRRRMLLAVAAAIATLVLALAVIPGARAPQPTVAAAASPEPVTSTTSAPVLTADDPAAAAIALLAARHRCRQQLSVLCLDGVDDDGSAAMAADRAAIQAAQDGGELGDDPLAEAGAPQLTERLGDSALIRLGPDAAAPSMLVLRATGGWRIRDVLPGPSPTPAAGG